MPIRLFTLSVVLVLLLAPVALAKEPKVYDRLPSSKDLKAEGEDCGPFGCEVDPQLPIDTQQRLREIGLAYAETIWRLNQELSIVKARLNLALTERDMDKTKVKAAVDEINALRSEIFTVQVGMQVELIEEGMPIGMLNLGKKRFKSSVRLQGGLADDGVDMLASPDE